MKSHIWLLAILAFTVAGTLYSTRWAYYDETVRGVTHAATVRVNRWTGTRQVFRCGTVLNSEAQDAVRSLQAQLVGIVEASPETGLRGLGVPEAKRRLRPCPDCPVRYDLAPEIAGEPPFS